MTLLAQATELARTGRHADAERLLLVSPTREGPTPGELDLLARIQAQQGRLGDAHATWTEALRLEPSNSEYVRGLDRLSELQRRPRRTRSWGRILAVLGTVAVAVAIVVLTSSGNELP